MSKPKSTPIVTRGENLTGPDFLGRKDAIIAALRDQIDNSDLDGMARVRAMKRSL